MTWILTLWGCSFKADLSADKNQWKRGHLFCYMWCDPFSVCCRWEDHPADSGSDQIRACWVISDHQRIWLPLKNLPTRTFVSSSPGDNEVMVTRNSYSHWGVLYYMKSKNTCWNLRGKKTEKIMLPNVVEIKLYTFYLNLLCVMVDYPLLLQVLYK